MEEAESERKALEKAEAEWERAQAERLASEKAEAERAVAETAAMAAAINLAVGCGASGGGEGAKVESLGWRRRLVRTTGNSLQGECSQPIHTTALR